MFLWILFEKQTKIVAYMDLWKYGPILTIQNSQTRIWLRLTRKGSKYEFIISNYNPYEVINKNL
jgi:hypothetical protein